TGASSGRARHNAICHNQRAFHSLGPGSALLAQSTTAVAQARPLARTSLDWITPALAAIFVLSGASGLVYQIAWVRLLALTFGVTIDAISSVVPAFMGGLAVGSFLGGRRSEERRVGKARSSTK